MTWKRSHFTKETLFLFYHNDYSEIPCFRPEKDVKKLAKTAHRLIDMIECDGMEYGFLLANLVTTFVSPIHGSDRRREQLRPAAHEWWGLATNAKLLLEQMRYRSFGEVARASQFVKYPTLCSELVRWRRGKKTRGTMDEIAEEL